MTPEELTENEDNIVRALRGNNVTALSQLLYEHFWQLSKQSLKGFTPNSDLAGYWRQVARTAQKMGNVKQ